jgi:hypothetical protein
MQRNTCRVYLFITMGSLNYDEWMSCIINENGCSWVNVIPEKGCWWMDFIYKWWTQLHELSYEDTLNLLASNKSNKNNVSLMFI